MADYRASESIRRQMGHVVDYLDEARDLIAKARRLADEIECDAENNVISCDIQDSAGDFTTAEEIVSNLRRMMEGLWLSIEVVEAEEEDDEEEDSEYLEIE